MSTLWAVTVLQSKRRLMVGGCQCFFIILKSRLNDTADSVTVYIVYLYPSTCRPKPHFMLQAPVSLVTDFLCCEYVGLFVDQ